MKNLNQLNVDDKGLEMNFPALLREAEPRLTKNGKDYLKGTLQTKTGEIGFNKWSLSMDEKKALKTGVAVQVTGIVDVFNGNVQLNVSDMVVIPVEPDEFKLTLMKSVEVLEKELNDLIAEIKNTKIKATIERLLKEAGQIFLLWCAAKTMHHNDFGGLGTHTVAVMKLVSAACDFYNSAGIEVNKDVCLCAAFLHDYGKLKELQQTEAGNGEYTADSILGHIFIGAHIAMAEFENGNWDYETARQVAHCVLAHHGALENGSPVEPCTPEAAILSSCDNMDAQVTRIATDMLTMQEKQFKKGVYNRPLSI